MAPVAPTVCCRNRSAPRVAGRQRLTNLHRAGWSAWPLSEGCKPLVRSHTANRRRGSWRCAVSDDLVRDIIYAHFWAVDENGNMGTVPTFWGPPASAKTALYRQAVRELGLPMLRLSVLATGEGKFGCIPRHNDRGRLEFPAPVDLDCFSYELKRDGTPDYAKPLWADETPRGVLFLDEFNGRPDLQAAMMDMTAERVWGSYYMGEGVRACMAANPTEISAGGYEPPEPLVSRVGHYDIEAPDHDAWTEYMGAKFDGTSLPKRPYRARAGSEVLAKYLDTEKRRDAELPVWLSEASAQVCAFTGIASSAVTKDGSAVLPYFEAPRKPSAAECRGRYATPNRRAWVYATATLASARWQRFGVVVQQEVVAAFVGDDVAAAFMAWVDRNDLPSPRALLLGNEEFRHNPNRPDRTTAVAEMLVAEMQKARPGAAGQAAVSRGWTILNEIRKAAGDDTVASLTKPLIEAGLYGPRYGADAAEFVRSVDLLVSEMKK